MKPNCLILLLIGVFFLGCSSDPKKEKSITITKKVRGLDDIKKSGTLNVITSYSPTSYFLYKGTPMGFEYELLNAFAKHLDVTLNIEIISNMDEMIPHLNDGKTDLLAYGMTITNERKKIVSFSDAIYTTKQVLVQQKPKNWRKLHWKTLDKSLLKAPIELLDDTVSIRANTAYMERILNLSSELGGTIHIDTVSGYLTTTEIIEKVALGELKYTVADNNLAKIMQAQYDNLDISVPISFSQRSAWATRHNTPLLLNELNKWLAEAKKTTDYYVIYNKYFKNKRSFKRRAKSDFFSLNSNKISQYDDLIQKYAAKINWDWRLLAALICQESKFDKNSISWAGAQGLMQLMGPTARELGVVNRSNPEDNLKGGTKYLDKIWLNFDNISDNEQRLKFTMASYNCGYYHVLDAQKLARKRGLNPNKWDGNVENAILKLSEKKYFSDPMIKYGYVRGIEPYNYVREIFERYEHYKKFIAN